MKIVVLDGEIANPGDLSWAGIQALGELTIYENTTKEQLGQRIQDAEIVITNKVPLRAEAIQKVGKLQYIGLLSTGYNQIDLSAARQRGIPVCNVPEYSTDSVAQQTFALLLEITNHVGYYASQVGQGRWQKSGEWCFFDLPIQELAGKTMGIVGFGNIGKAVAKIAAAFGMQVLATGSARTTSGEGVARLVSLEELLEKSDVVSLHIPLLPDTEEIINENTLQKMKQGAILLNTSRGGLVNEKALAAALKSGKIKAAGLDVVSKEPIRDDNPLLGAPNCFITPHVAWVSFEARSRLLAVVEQNIRAYLAGNPQNNVNDR